MANLEATLRKQLDIHHRISRTVDNMKKLGKDKITVTVINTRLQLLDAQWDKFQSYHGALLTAQTEEMKSIDYFEKDLYTECEESFFFGKSGIARTARSNRQTFQSNGRFINNVSLAQSCRPGAS